MDAQKQTADIPGSDPLAVQAEYWRRILAGVPGLIGLPTDRPRPSQPDHSSGAVDLELGPHLTAGLRELSQRHGATLFITVLAAWAALLVRLSGQEDVVIGTPVARRKSLEVGSSSGVLLNTLALRIDLSGDPSVGELLRRVKERARGAQLNQDLPFEQVTKIANLSRGTAHHPLFQVLINWRARSGGGTASGLSAEPLGVPCDVEKVDLVLDIIEIGDGVVGGLIYATALFDRGTIERHGDHLRNFLQAMVDDDSRAVSALSLLGAAEMHRILVEWGAPQVVAARDGYVPEWFEAQAARTPEAVAVVHGSRSLSYGELNAQANQLARHLRAHGVRRDARVGLCLERSPELVLGIVATLKAGGAYVPLDPGYPAERLATMLADCAVTLVLTQGSTDARMRLASVAGDPPSVAGAPLIINLQAQALSWAEQSTADLAGAEIERSPEDLAYVICTSGSTGRPKAAQVTHRGLSNLLEWYLQDVGLAASEPVLLVTSHSFDLTQKNILGPLSIGGTLHLAGEPFDARAIVEQVQRERIAHLNLAPSAFHALIDADLHGQLRGLRRVVLGGEPIQVARLRALPEPRPQFINSYGPTECSDVVSWYRLSADLDAYVGVSVPIGQPIRNTRLYILDDHGQPVPAGVIGEIHIGGVGVGRGYLNRPELTAERFVDDPFAGEPGARLYKTGDLGRWRSDGHIEYLGRNDFQVKIRGFRIELGEIEAQLVKCAGVQAVVVLAREGAPHAAHGGGREAGPRADGERAVRAQPAESGEKRLVAYLTAQAGKELSAGQLRSELATKLPEYMVPSGFVILEAFPLTPNGKLDRQALPAPAAQTPVADEAEGPVGEVEVAIAGIWTDILSLERISRHDNFFDLGGHSLLAERVVSQVRRTLGAEVTLENLFLRPVLREFAEIARRAARSPLTVGRPHAAAHSIERPEPPREQAYSQDQPTAAALSGVVSYRTGGTQPALFLIQESAEHDPGFSRLAQHIHPDIPIYGLANQTLEQRPLRTIEGMATRLLQTLRILQRTGPYRLVGRGDSAVLAYEMAVQLVGKDQQVEFIGVLEADRAMSVGSEDCPPPAPVAALEHAIANYVVCPLPVTVHLLVARPPGWAAFIAEQQIRLIEVPGPHDPSPADERLGVIGRVLSNAITQGPHRRIDVHESRSLPPVVVQSGDSGNTPVFCVPGAGDSSAAFVALAAALGPEWPVQALQPRGADGLLVPHSTVEAAAAAYIAAIGAAQPPGPLHLLGHSFGGWVAFEMALQLRARGWPVASLTVIDIEAPGQKDLFAKEYTAGETLRELIRSVELAGGKSLGIDFVKIGLQDPAGQILLLHEHMVAAGLLPSRSRPDVLRGAARAFATALRTVYQPQQAFPGPMRLVLARNPLIDERANEDAHRHVLAGWQRWARAITCWRSAGDHFSAIRPPHVKALADFWRGSP